MTNDFRLWKGQVRQVLEHLGRLPGPGRHQQAVTEELVLTFRGLLGQLYQDAYFTEFVNSRAWQQAGLSEYVGQQLAALQQQLNAFDEPDTDAELVAHPQWPGILWRAGLVASLLG